MLLTMKDAGLYLRYGIPGPNVQMFNLSLAFEAIGNRYFKDRLDGLMADGRSFPMKRCGEINCPVCLDWFGPKMVRSMMPR